MDGINHGRPRAGSQAAKEDAKATMLFSVRDDSDRPGALSAMLERIRDCGVSLTRIESRPAAQAGFAFDFLVEFPLGAKNSSGAARDGDAQTQTQSERKAGKDAIQKVTRALAGEGIKVKVLSRGLGLEDADVAGAVGAGAGEGGEGGAHTGGKVAEWFPRSMRDLEKQSGAVYSGGAELDADHPGFKDEIYKARRQEIAALSADYKFGDKIPYIEYTSTENETWKQIYNELTKLYPTHACTPFNRCFQLLEQHAGYTPEKIPQLQAISEFIHDCTGFQLKPVTGLLSPREFLNGLAFRVFHSTQYIRHHSRPLYTPEPDVCHELLGHVPLFCDRDFAEFSQEIGLASLGASEEQIGWLSTTYWFTVEFGVCREKGNLRAYGAGLLSSFGELRYSLGHDPDGAKPEYEDFTPERAAKQEYPITTYQPKYFIADSFKKAKLQMQHYSKQIERPFVPRYDPYTQRIELIENNSHMEGVLHNVYHELSILEHALGQRR